MYRISSIEVWVDCREEMIMARVISRLLSFAQRLMNYGCTLWFERLDISLIERVNK